MVVAAINGLLGQPPVRIPVAVIWQVAQTSVYRFAREAHRAHRHLDLGMSKPEPIGAVAAAHRERMYRLRGRRGGRAGECLTGAQYIGIEVDFSTRKERRAGGGEKEDVEEAGGSEEDIGEDGRGDGHDHFGGLKGEPAHDGNGQDGDGVYRRVTGEGPVLN